MCNTVGYNIAPWGDICGVTVPRPVCLTAKPSEKADFKPGVGAHVFNPST